MNKILTISVAAYNAEQYMAKCLDSFLNSKVSNELEIIVVNDGSEDKTLEIVKEYQRKYPETIYLIDKVNGGHGSTINASISKATGKYYKVVDADDWVSQDGIEKLVEFLKDTDCDLVINPYIETYIDRTPDKLVIPYKNVKLENIYNFKDVYQNIDIPMHAMTLKTTIIQTVGAVIDENCFYVDMEYNLYPIKYIQTICFLKTPIYYYLLGNQQQSVSIRNMVKRRNQRETVIKSLIRDYNDSISDLGKEKSDYIIMKIHFMIYTHYKMYLYLEEKESLREVKLFDQWLKQNSSYEIYYGLSSGIIMNFIRFQRKFSFRSYKMILKILHTLHMIPIIENL